MTDDINISLPGWEQIIDMPHRKVFESNDGYKFVLNTQGEFVDISVEEET